MIETIVLLCTLFGGIAAVWYFWEKLGPLLRLSRFSFLRAPAIPMDPRSLFAYANGNERLLSLTKKIAAKRGLKLRNIDSESAWLNECIEKAEIKTVRELDSYVRKYGDDAVKLTDYVAPEGEIDSGLLLGMVLEILAIERGGQQGIREFNSNLKFSSGGKNWADEIYAAYHQIKHYS